ncbi:ABC transporter ATP-binding protein [bacterium]|nr:MAG: ABC transporter ATP-binding protein [bacterium]
MSGEFLLEARDVAKAYFGSRVLKSVSITLKPGTITALIGPNGAGKTTLFDVIAGFVQADSGTVCYDGTDITRLPAYARARCGIVKTFQIPHEFGGLSVLENLLVAGSDQIGERFPLGLLAKRKTRAQERANTERADGILQFLGLSASRDADAETLSAGEKKLLELARALMLDPKLLMLDEPLAGVPFDVREQILEHLVSIRERGKTLLLVEHNLEAVMRVADWVYVLVDGELLASGRPGEVQSNENVHAAYLGRA